MKFAGWAFSSSFFVFVYPLPLPIQANYAGVVILDCLVLLLAAILNPRARRRRAREATLECGDVENGTSSNDGMHANSGAVITDEEKESRRIQDKEALEFPAGTPGRILHTDSHHLHEGCTRSDVSHVGLSNTGLESRQTTIVANDHEEMEKHRSLD
jgi:hypothetical protein